MAGIDDIIADFESELEEISAQDFAMAKGEATVETVSEEEGNTCVSKRFKELVEVLPGFYVGTNMKEFVFEFLNSMPECEV